MSIERVGAFLGLLVAAALVYAQGVITTVAGGGSSFKGNGGPATLATLGQIDGVAVDSAGNVYATDFDHHLVVRISPGGVLTVVAGNGIAGFSGDGGPAINASLNRPQSVATDTAGNVYVADTSNVRVRRIAPDGTISTVAGNGRGGFSGDNGPAASAQLNSVISVAVDAAGNLYIGDRNNHRVRRVDSRGIITTFAGSGATGSGNGGYSGDGGLATAAQLNEPWGLAVDGAGSLYLADRLNHRIRKITTNGTISTIAGTGTAAFSGDGGAATAASLSFPQGVALDTFGNLYVTANSRIRRITAAGIITTVAGGGSSQFFGDGVAATTVLLLSPVGVAVDAGANIYIAESGNERIRKVANGTISTLAGAGPQGFGDGGAATNAALTRPRGIAFDGTGNLYISDQRNHRIRKVTPAGVITTVAGMGIAGFSGDGGQATAAAVNLPQGIAFSPSGNLYIADNGNARVRRVAPGGIMSTVAGGGGGGDGGPAVSASLSGVQDVAVDAAGNVYVAEAGTSHRIRKVNPSGIISTVAGIATTPGYSGDGGPATAASLNAPRGLTMDSTGNLYIADQSNHRVRQVRPDGTIVTVAGNGQCCNLGNGGPAISAALNFPSGVTLDTAGNLYIVDGSGVRKVDAAGTITKVAGSGIFAGDGGLAVNATLSSPQDATFDNLGNLFIADTNNDRIRKILAVAPTFSTAPAALTFAAPAGASLVAEQQLTVLSPVTGLAWNAQASTQDGKPWLLVSPSSGSAPGIITVKVALTGLAIGTYQGTITVQVSLADPTLRTVPVQLTVQDPLADKLLVEPISLTFEAQASGANPPVRTVRISDAGTGSLNWTAQAATTSGGNWLAVSPASGAASTSSPVDVTVSAAVAGLAAGAYSGSVTVRSSTTSEVQVIPVTLLLSQLTQTILLSQTGLLFTGVEGGTIVPKQTFGILNTSQGTMNWTASARTLSGGNWLTVSQVRGSSTAGSLIVPTVDVNVAVTGLTNGQYSGQIRVEATGALNSPQFVNVVLNVLPRGSNPGVLVRPKGLIFVRPEGSSSPSSQEVRLATAIPESVGVVANPSTFSGDEWLDVQPRNQVISPNQPASLTFQPDLGTLTAGEHFATATLLFTDFRSQAVEVLLVVVPPVAGTAPARHGSSDAQAGGEHIEGCTPSKLYLAPRAVGANLAAVAGWPNVLEVQVKNDCGDPEPGATVIASFSSGDPALALVSLQNGIYQGNWQPRQQQAQVTISFTARLSGLTAAQHQTQLAVTGNPAGIVPQIAAGGVVHAASYTGAALAPGAIISLFGANLTRGAALTNSLPLPTTLNSVTLNVAGTDIPLFYSGEKQVNAHLPLDLNPNSRPQVILKTRLSSGAEVFTNPETITLAAFAPGIFTIDQSGSGQGAIQIANTTLFAAPAGSIAGSTARPANRGEFLTIYCSGLGAVSNPPARGTPAKGDPLSRTLTAPEVSIGGRPALVDFAGLSPEFVGLYQVNVQIPADAPTGDAVPLVLSIGGFKANTVTVALR